MLLLPAILVSFPGEATGQSAISLLRFTAAGRGNDILVEWETATEFNNAGFFVWASDREAGVYNPISDFIEAQGDGATGAIYGFIDTEVEPGVVKYYKLEAIELNQDSEFYGPIAGVFYLATPSATGTAANTSTATLASASTPSPTATQTAGVQINSPTFTQPATLASSPTPPPTATFSSNQSAYPGQATATATQTAAFNSLGTPYLAIPTPTPQLAYPAQEITPTARQAEPLPLEATRATKPTRSPSSGTLPAAETNLPQEVAQLSQTDGMQIPPFMALVIVLLIWAMLAGWFYISVRRLE